MEMTARKVIIIGGGIGGLAAALALLKRGIDVEVYEQAPELKEAGAGIQIGSNGTRVLYALGLEQTLGDVCVRPSARELRHWRTGETWNWFDLGESSEKRFGTPHLMLHRGDLQAALINAVQAVKRDAIVLNKTCSAVAQSSDLAEARFQDGTSASAPLLIGADGIHSTVRAVLFGPSKPEFTGCVAWRGLIPAERLPAHLHRLVGTTWLGPRGFVLHYPVRRGELMNFVSVVERGDWQVESWVVPGTKGELGHDFSGWHADVQTLIESIETPYKWALMVRGPMDVWSRGRITLLGDACHPTLPFLGQGAVMAIEDAYILAACIEKYFDDPAKAFARYEEIRRDRTANVVLRAQENRAMAFAPRLADEDAVADLVAMDWMNVRRRERLDWLYNYDATAIPI
jgi:salicylate hydroxylase